VTPQIACIGLSLHGLVDQSGGPIGVAKFFAISPAEGAETIAYLASSSDVATTTGQYFYKCLPTRPCRRHATPDLFGCCGSVARHCRLEGKWFAAALTPRTKGDALQLYDLHSTFLSFIAPFILDLQRHLDHPPDCFRPRRLVGLLLSPFVDAGCECWRHT